MGLETTATPGWLFRFRSHGHKQTDILMQTEGASFGPLRFKFKLKVLSDNHNRRAWYYHFKTEKNNYIVYRSKKKNMATKLEIKQFGTSWSVGTLVCRDAIITLV